MRPRSGEEKLLRCQGNIAQQLRLLEHLPQKPLLRHRRSEIVVPDALHLRRKLAGGRQILRQLLFFCLPAPLFICLVHFQLHRLRGNTGSLSRSRAVDLALHRAGEAGNQLRRLLQKLHALFVLRQIKFPL